jgi:FtsZ-interacting cell division protein ZipA
VGKFLLVILVFAAIVYSLFWLWERRRRSKLPRPSTPRATAYKRTMGPDDDEDFLRELERRRRHAAREQQDKTADPTDKKMDQKPGKKQAKQPDPQPNPEPGQARSEHEHEQDQPRPE